MTPAQASTALEVDRDARGAVVYYSAPRVVRITDAGALEFTWAGTPPGATTRIGALWLNIHADTAPLDEPDLGVSPQGHLQATWRVRERGMVVLAFRPDGRIRYAGASGPTVPGQPRDKVSGLADPTAALKAVSPLLAGS